MARIFITGSADGLGRMAAQQLVDGGHRVVLHARSMQRAHQAQEAVPGAEAALAADLAIMAEVERLARELNAMGRFDAVIHNAAVGYAEPHRVTVDGFAHVLAINSLAPYLLTALIERPKRLVWLSSGLHKGADASLDDLNWERRAWSGYQAYSDSKLHDAILSRAIARLWPDVLSNSVDPGWVATKMGGAGAPDDLEAAPRTQVWLATSGDAAACVSGGHFFHQAPRETDPAVRDVAVQEALLSAFEAMTGVPMPATPERGAS
jgi:NAD(P)-dependent dehydrogenase (short-subunit alcohol dehydrogenase family)